MREERFPSDVIGAGMKWSSLEKAQVEKRASGRLIEQFSPKEFEVEEIVAPSSFTQFIILDGTAIRLGLWPKEVYAGRMMARIGERVAIRELHRCGDERI